MGGLVNIALNLELKPFTPGDTQRWNACVRAASNGTFLHERGFMDYHADRFDDCSLMVCNAKGAAVAVLPANRVNDVVHSHGGLTFGGLLMTPTLGVSACLAVFEQLKAHYAALGASTLLYKPVPRVFQRIACEDDLYALSRLGAQLVRRDASTVIDMANRPKWGKGRQWIVNKGRKAGVQVQQLSDPRLFLHLLCEALARHGASPVHTAEEMSLLMQRFPLAVRLYGALLDGRLLAGSWVFDFGHTVHTQYLANSTEGREVGALDFLVAELIDKEYADRRFFSFGISTEQQGQVLNSGLAAFKESYGGHTTVNDFYRLDLR